MLIRGTAGEWDGILLGLFNRYEAASPPEKERFGRAIENDFRQMLDKGFPKSVVQFYRGLYEFCSRHTDK